MLLFLCKLKINIVQTLAKTSYMIEHLSVLATMTYIESQNVF